MLKKIFTIGILSVSIFAHANLVVENKEGTQALIPVTVYQDGSGIKYHMGWNILKSNQPDIGQKTFVVDPQKIGSDGFQKLYSNDFSYF